MKINNPLLPTWPTLYVYKFSSLYINSRYYILGTYGRTTDQPQGRRRKNTPPNLIGGPLLNKIGDDIDLCRLLSQRKRSIALELALLYLRIDFVTALQMQAQIGSERELCAALWNATGDFGRLCAGRLRVLPLPMIVSAVSRQTYLLTYVAFQILQAVRTPLVAAQLAKR